MDDIAYYLGQLALALTPASLVLFVLWWGRRRGRAAEYAAEPPPTVEPSSGEENGHPASGIEEL